MNGDAEAVIDGACAALGLDPEPGLQSLLDRAEHAYNVAFERRLLIEGEGERRRWLESGRRGCVGRSQRVREGPQGLVPVSKRGGTKKGPGSGSGKKS